MTNKQKHVPFSAVQWQISDRPNLIVAIEQVMHDDKFSATNLLSAIRQKFWARPRSRRTYGYLVNGYVVCAVTRCESNSHQLSFNFT